MNTAKTNVEEDNKQDVVLRLEVLKIIKEAQNQHGLKHGDYHRYRLYCSRRLHRIRKSLKQSNGNRSRGIYLKNVNNQNVVDACFTKKDPVRYLMIPLFCAERAWGYAIALKHEANNEKRKRIHSLKRFKKALYYSKNLEKLCNEEPNKCDLRTKLESQAYNLFLQGMFFFEVENWINTSEYLKKAQAIYSKISDILEQSEQKEIYLNKIEEIKPVLRYCAFNLNEQGSTDLLEKINSDELQDEFLAKKLDQLLILEREKNSVYLSEVTWLGKIISIKHDPIRLFLTDIGDFELDSLKITRIEKKLYESRDCLQLLKELNKEKSALYCYIFYHRQKLSCKRSLELIKTLKNPTELIRPYEIIISSLQEIKQLQLNEYFQDNDAINKLLNDIESQINAYKAFKCHQIKKSHRLDWKISLALLHKSNQYIEICFKNENLDENLKNKLFELQTNNETEKYTILANNLVKEEKSSETELISQDYSLFENLDFYNNKFTTNDKLINFPPKYKAIPCKPLFFDLAYYKLKFPSLEEETGTSKQKTSGITKIVKGWFWK